MTKKYVTTNEAAKQTGVKSRKICELCRDGIVSSKKDTGNKYMVDINSLISWLNQNPALIKNPRFLGNPNLVFGNLSVDFDTVFQPILSENKNDEIFDTDRHEYKLQYWISNRGEIYDCDTGIYLKKNIKNTYYYVNLKKNFDGQYDHIYVHECVAYYFCKGRLRFNVNQVHHINNQQLDNNYKNLLWVTELEHKELHKLMKSDKKAYRKRIREIQKENKAW